MSWKRLLVQRGRQTIECGPMKTGECSKRQVHMLKSRLRNVFEICSISRTWNPTNRDGLKVRQSWSMQAWNVETKGKLKPLNVRLVYKFVSLKICNRNTRTHFKLSDFHTNFGKLSRCQTLILSNFEPLTLCDSASLLSPHTSAHSGFGSVQPMHSQCIALNARWCFSVLQAFSKTKMTGRPPHFIRNS